MATQTLGDKKLLALPSLGNDSDVFFYIKNHTIDWKYLNYLKIFTTFSDDIISDWLNISVKTLRAYRKPESNFKENLKEHIVLLLALYKHGISVFETKEAFDNWLATENVFFDFKAPQHFLDTISGIKFIDDRLTAIAYGDNV